MFRFIIFIIEFLLNLSDPAALLSLIQDFLTSAGGPGETL